MFELLFALTPSDPAPEETRAARVVTEPPPARIASPPPRIRSATTTSVAGTVRARIAADASPVTLRGRHDGEATLMAVRRRSGDEDSVPKPQLRSGCQSDSIG